MCRLNFVIFRALFSNKYSKSLKLINEDIVKSMNRIQKRSRVNFFLIFEIVGFWLYWGL